MHLYGSVCVSVTRRRTCHARQRRYEKLYSDSNSLQLQAKYTTTTTTTGFVKAQYDPLLFTRMVENTHTHKQKINNIWRIRILSAPSVWNSLPT